MINGFHCWLRRVRVVGLVVFFAGLLILQTLQLAVAEQENLVLHFNEVLDNHPEVVAHRNRTDAALELIQEAKDAYYPSLSFTGSYGLEHTERKNKGQINTIVSDLSPSDLRLEVKENVFRGGADGSNVALQEASLETERVELENKRQNLLLRMITAYVNVQRFDQLLALARLSVENIQHQTELENTRIERGKGYNADLLQAKAQLAESHAREVRAEKGLTQSVNVYRNLFDELPQLTDAPVIVVPEPALPENLDVAIGRAIANSLEIKSARSGVNVAESRLGVIDGMRFGSLDIVGGVRSKTNVDGAEADAFNYYAKLQYTMTTSLPSIGSHAIGAAGYRLEASRSAFAVAQRDAILRVRQAWTDFGSANEVAVLESDRARIAEEFLNLVRREHELNRRSLLEVLNGETSLYAARIQSTSAKADSVIAAYSLLRSMGLLRTGSIIAMASDPKIE